MHGSRLVAVDMRQGRPPDTETVVFASERSTSSLQLGSGPEYRAATVCPCYELVLTCLCSTSSPICIPNTHDARGFYGAAFLVSVRLSIFRSQLSANCY